MESKNRHVLGRSFVLERQERYSFQTNERIYLNGHRFRQNPTTDVAGKSSSSDEIEKIHRARERVDSLNHRINFEIERLKDFKDSLENNKDEKLMTWAERFMANPPLINVLNKNLGNPGSKKVKQKDVSPRKPPPPKELPPTGISPEENPKKLTPNGLPPERPSPVGLPEERFPKMTPPMKLPPKELPPKELPPKERTYILLPTKEMPPKGLPHKELNTRQPPPKVIPAKETPPNGLPTKELNPRKPTTGALPSKELPPKGVPPKGLPPKELPPKTIPPKGVRLNNIPPKGVPPKTIHPRGVSPKALPPKGVPPKGVPRKGVPPKGVPPKAAPPKNIPPKGVPPKGFPPKSIPPKVVPPKAIPPKGAPPKATPPKGVPSKGVPLKTIPPKVVPLKTTPPKRVPPKIQKGVQTKEVTLRKPPPKLTPPKNPPTKRLPQKELPLKKTPPKAPITRKAPPKKSTQTEVKPEKTPPKEVTPRKPIPKEEEEPKLGSLRDDATPEELAARISGGCCHCYYPFDQCCCPTFGGGCYVATDCTGDMGFNRGVQYGVQYCTAKRRVTDLNTEEICSNRCVGISPDRISNKCSPSRESTRDKKKCPMGSRRTSPANKNRNQEKLPNVKTQEKIQKVASPRKCPEKIMKEKPLLKKNCQSPRNIKQEKAPKKDIPKLDISPIASPIKDQNISVDERMYEDYLKLYYQELSKTDLLESARLTPTYTRLEDTAQRESPAEPLRRNTDSHGNSKDGQRVSICRDSQEVKPPIRERKEHEPSRCSTEMYPGAFSYEECFDEQHHRSPDNKRTKPDSYPHATTPIDCRCPQPQHPKSTRCQDKDRQAVRPESIMAKVLKDVCGERSSLARDWETDGTSYASLPVNRQIATPSTRQGSITTEPQRGKERSLLTYPLSSSEKPTKVYNDRQRKISSGARSPRKDSPRRSNLSSGAGSPRKAHSPSTDSPRLGSLSPISFREGSFRDSGRQSPISFGANSSRTAPSQTTDSACDTIVMNPDYQTEDTQCSCRDCSDKGFKYDPRFEEKTSFEDAYSTFSGKTARSSNESPQRSFIKLIGYDHEISGEERPGSPRRNSQSKARNSDQARENEYRNKYYSSATEDILSRCECNGYETARSIDSSKHGSLLTGRSSSPEKSCDESTCEKRMRTVTFKDEQGDLEKQRQLEEECRNQINWEEALNHGRHDDNYTPRSSSSAEHTCLESSCGEEDAYDSCYESPFRTDEQMGSFKACPCMYETYRQLAALCQTKSPYYR